MLQIKSYSFCNISEKKGAKGFDFDRLDKSSMLRLSGGLIKHLAQIKRQLQCSS